MEKDILTLVGAVGREVAGGERDGQPVRRITATRTYPSDIADVWDAITNPERIPRWLLPVSGDLRLGGTYQLEGQAGGDITACEPPTHLALTWCFNGQESWVEAWLEPAGEDATRLRVEHAAPVDDDTWGQFGPGAVGVGWDLMLLGLGMHLERGGDVDGDAWAATAEGRGFVVASSDDWCRASIASGTPADAARQAADRTTAAYTGEAPAEG